MRHGSVRDWLNREYARGRSDERKLFVEKARELPKEEFLDLVETLTGRDPRGD